MMMPDESIKIGRQIYLSGTLSYFDEARNPGEFNQKQFYQQRGTIFSITDAKLMAFTLSYGTIRQFLYEFKKQNEILLTKYVDAENAAILKAMLFGNKSEIDTDVKELFQKNGIAHILAISGVKMLLLALMKHPQNRTNTAFLDMTCGNKYIIIQYILGTIMRCCRSHSIRGVIFKKYDLAKGIYHLA